MTEAEQRILEHRSGALIRAYEAVAELAQSPDPFIRRTAQRAIVELETAGQSLEREYRARKL